MTGLGNLLLFVFCNATSYRLQRYIIERAVAVGRPVALLFTGGSGAFFSEVLSDAARLRIEAFALDDEAESSTASPPRWPAKKLIGWRVIVSTLALWKMPEGNQAAVFRKAWARRLNASLQLMRRLRVGVIVCSEDGISSDLAVFAAARGVGASIVDIPFGNGTRHELEVDLGRKREERRLIVATGRELALLRLVAPQWIKTGLHAGAIMFPPDMILAMESLGLTLRDAWIIHGGMSDILCVENGASLLQYENERIPAAKLRMTGSPYCDVMVDALRDDPVSAAALRQPRSIESGCIRILVSWPPSYHATYPGRNEFATYEAMTIAVLTFLQRLPNVRLTVSLHPACGEEVAALLQKQGISIASDYLLKLIPANDIFVTYFSSTIRWALAAGKPVVNYDAYNIELKAYERAPGFLNSGRFEQFCALISRLVDSEAALADIMSRQIEVADHWGILDGLCTQRIFGEIDELIGS